MTPSASDSNPAPVSPAAVAMDAFFTRQRANEGVELPLDLPDGTPTRHRIRIRGIDSDHFRTAQAESRRRLVEMATSAERVTLNAEDMESERLKMLASLVASWTFDLPCTIENVVSFLREAPQIAQQIDKLSAKRNIFFRNGSQNSMNSREPNSN